MRNTLFKAILLLCTLQSVTILGQSISDIDSVFEKIRKNEAMLQLFFSQMPKGGDLHNHLTGSVYAETYFNIGCKNNMWLDTLTLQLDPSFSMTKIRLSESMKEINKWRSKCINNWSVFNYDSNQSETPPDEFFFKTFGDFGAAVPGNYEQFLNELRARAENENVSYLEIMAISPTIPSDMLYEKINQSLNTLIKAKDKTHFIQTLSNLFEIWEGDKSIHKKIEEYALIIDSLHNVTKNTSPNVITTYQVYATRNAEPIKVFAQLYFGYKACQLSEYIVGVNILQPENNPISIRNYWGHMYMFNFLSSKYKNTNLSIHAGELALGMVPPENLSNHIYDAVDIAKAKRIGHGVDIAFETWALDLLQQMKNQNIAVEINLTSNEFILGIKDDSHPIMLYYKSGVPFVLCTDDAGILRTNLSQQYVLAAKRYPELKYNDFKTLIFNSIEYSFASGKTKKELKERLIQDINIFEQTMLSKLSDWNL